MKNISLIMLMALFFSTACNKVLDKENLTAVSPSDVWNNLTIAQAYMDNIYANLMPGNPTGTGNDTDEACTTPTGTNVWLSGKATLDSYDAFDQYYNIRSINILLDNINRATFDTTIKNQLKGQGLFWRAWAYYSLVKSYGGVPLILEAQNPTSDLTTLAIARSKTSECVAQILKDLDDAAQLLPDKWTGEDVGKIDKGALMAFKGRVLLFFASPLFNGLGGIATWQKAYDANKAANDFLIAQGKGLYSPYNKIWDDELNKEVVMVRRYNYPQATYFQGGLISLDFSKDQTYQDRPSLDLVNSFPMKDGSSWNSQPRDYATLFKDRDDRFVTDIYYNGCPIQYAKGMREKNTYLWTYYDVITDYYSVSGIAGQHNQLTADQFPSPSSFFRMKAIDKNINASEVHKATVDWPEIRYTEVLMNYGECANEIGNTQAAFEVLKQIRQRAGILSGTSGNYGLTGTSQDAIRTLYQNERFVEFCFEGKRWDDLRRWKMFGYLRNLTKRHGLAIELKLGETGVNPMDDINKVYTKFKNTIITTDQDPIAIKDDYYIYGIPKTRLDRNAKLQQNNNWGGSFDPYQ